MKKTEEKTVKEIVNDIKSGKTATFKYRKKLIVMRRDHGSQDFYVYKQLNVDNSPGGWNSWIVEQDLESHVRYVMEQLKYEFVPDLEL